MTRVLESLGYWALEYGVLDSDGVWVVRKEIAGDGGSVMNYAGE